MSSYSTNYGVEAFFFLFGPVWEDFISILLGYFSNGSSYGSFVNEEVLALEILSFISCSCFFII